MRRGTVLLAFSLLCGLVAAVTVKVPSEFGIEGMAMASILASEAKPAAIPKRV